MVSIHALLAECDTGTRFCIICVMRFNPRTPCGVRRKHQRGNPDNEKFQSTHSLRSATCTGEVEPIMKTVSIHALLAECDLTMTLPISTVFCFNPRTPCGVRLELIDALAEATGFNPRTPCGVRLGIQFPPIPTESFQSTHSLRSATAPNLIHCYSTKQIILCANLPKKTVIARLLFLSIYLSIFYSQCITPIADLPGNSCELEVGAQAMFNSL